MRDCYYDTAGCLVCPELPPVSFRPDTAKTDPRTGWNAGANSIKTVAGDLHVGDTVDVPPAGIVIGLKVGREGQADPAAVLHGLYFYKTAGQPMVEVRELGSRVGSIHAFTAGATWEIRRVGAWMTYLVAGVVLAKTPARSLGPMLVNACLYAAPDGVP